jgi:hypothetical protein
MVWCGDANNHVENPIKDTADEHQFHQCDGNIR